MGSNRNTAVAGFAGIAAGLLGAICCLAAPVVLALGIGSGFMSAISPLRPLFGAAMVLFLGWGFYLVYGPRGDDGLSEDDEGTTARARRHPHRLFFWVAAFLAILLWSLPFLLEIATR